MVAITLVMGFLASLTNNGLEGYVTPLLMTAPIAAALFLSVRATVFSAGCVVCCFCLQIIFDNMGLVSQTAYPPEVTRIAALILLTTTTAISAAGMGYFVQDANKMIATMISGQTQLLEMTRVYERSAYHDALTGLANRKKLYEHLGVCLGEQASATERICLLHVDLVKFKEVNDTLGHPVGDGVLRTAATLMTEHFGPEALIARVGGDEFVIVQSLASREAEPEVERACQELIQKLQLPMSVNGVECQIDASIGYVFATMAGSTSDMLIANADIALYEAKRAGGGFAAQFNASMRERFDRRLETITDIERGLKEDWFICVMQPQICMKTGRIVGLEALSRLNHPHKGVLGTGVFIDLVEEIGVLDQIDNQVMQKALDQLVALREDGHQIPSVSINVSAKTLRTEPYAHDLQTAIAVRGLASQDVVVEVLESVLIEGEDDQAARTIDAIRAAGTHVVIDDFGAGHATLGNLSRLAVDGLKIDRSLMPDTQSERAIKIVEAVLTLAEGLGVPVVMEGVETIAQYQLMQRLGCTYAQGFLIARPLEMGRLQTWLTLYGSTGVDTLLTNLETELTAQAS